jgi:hypothetical protein
MITQGSGPSGRNMFGRIIPIHTFEAVKSRGNKCLSKLYTQKYLEGSRQQFSPSTQRVNNRHGKFAQISMNTNDTCMIQE